MTAKQSFWRDPVWQAVAAVIAAVALVIALAALFVQVKSYLDFREVKAARVVVLAQTSLLEVPSLVSGDIQVSYRGRPIPNLTLLEFRVQNSGNVPITSTDFERPIALSFAPGANILGAELVEASPTDLEMNVTVTGGDVVLDAVLLNPGDGAVYRVLVTYDEEAEPRDIAVSGRIIGVRNIDIVRAAEFDIVRNWREGWQWVVLSIVLLLVAVLLISYLQSHP